MMKKSLLLVLCLVMLLALLPAGALAGNVSGEEFVSFARENCLNIPYRSGGRTTAGFDCCGLVWYVCNHFGIDIGKGNQTSQINYGSPVSYSMSSYDAYLANLQLGDLIFFDYENDGVSNHVGIYSGNGNIIQAHRTGVNSKEDKLSGGWVKDGNGNYIAEWKLTCGIRRVLSSGGSSTIDVNGNMDGTEQDNLSNYGTFDVKIKRPGEDWFQWTDDLNDFYESLPVGTEYRIEDIRGKYGIQNVGESVYTGTIQYAPVKIVLRFVSGSDHGYNPDGSAFIPGEYRVKDGHTAYFREYPYEDAYSLPGVTNCNRTIHVNGCVKNNYGNIWYKITNPNTGVNWYCYSDHLAFVSTTVTTGYQHYDDPAEFVSEDSTLSINPARSSYTIVQGNSCSITGSIDSNYNITSVTATLDGNQYVNLTPNAKTVNIGATGSGQINSFKGKELSVGTHTIVITATDSSSKSVTKTITITVTGTSAPATYTVSYDANGGTGAPGNQTKTQGSALTLSSTVPTRTMYVFKGWSTSSSGSVQYQPGGSYTADANVTLYAVWEKGTYTITYDANGGTGAPGTQTFTYNSGEHFSTVVPTRTGYTFVNWKDDWDGGYYNPGDPIPDGWGSNTLRAQWSVNYYTLDVNGCLDGELTGWTSGYGTFDLYINGNLDYINGTVETSGIDDYCAEWPYGTTYEIKNIRATTGHEYNGVYSGALSGTIGADRVNVYLSFSTSNEDPDAGWSEWMTDSDYQAYTQSAQVYSQEQKTQYRYQDLSISDWTGETSRSGWERYDTRTYKSDWSGWSAWQDSYVEANDNTDVETQQVEVTAGYSLYRYGRYKSTDCSKGTHYMNNDITGKATYGGTWNPEYTEWSTTRVAGKSNTDCVASYQDSLSTGTYGSDGRYHWDRFSVNGKTYYWEETQTIDPVYKTQYRYRTRYDITEYKYSQWGGWSGWSDTAVSASGTRNVETRTLYRAILSYTVSYDANGGTDAPENQIKVRGSSLMLSNDQPTRADASGGQFTVTLDPNGGHAESLTLTAERTTRFSFANWNTASDGSGTNCYPGASYTANENVTLYAQWNSSTTTAAVELPTPTRSGYSFKCWATSSNAASGMSGSYTPSGNITLYAIWQKQSPDFVLPAALNEIGEEAFAGAAFSYVHLPEEVTKIDRRAFADCPNLRNIDIPAETTYIDSKAFEGVSNLTIHGEDGSYAEFYAVKYGFDFVAD